MKLSDMSTVKYNGVELSEVKYNGVSVWTSGPIIMHNATFLENGSPWNTQSIREGRYCAIPPAPDSDSFTGWTDSATGYAFDFGEKFLSDRQATARFGGSGRIGGLHFRNVDDCNFRNKVCLVRVDFNYTSAADMPGILRRHLPTIQAILAGGGRVGLLSGRGRPNGQVIETYSLKDCVAPLSEVLGTEVVFCTVPEEFLDRLSNANISVSLLENVEFFPQEVSSSFQGDFSTQLASNADVFVQDMTRQIGTNRPSIAGAAALMSEAVLGYNARNLCESAYTLAEGNLTRPYAAVVGGAFQDNMAVLSELAGRVDDLCLGGEMGILVNVLKGADIGTQNYDAADLTDARDIMGRLEQNSINPLIPVDYKAADSVDSQTYEVVGCDAIKPNHCLLDIGPMTMKIFADRIAGKKTVLWLGAMSTTTQPWYGGGLFMAQTVPYSGEMTAVCGTEALSLCKQLGNIGSFGGALDQVFVKYLGGVVPAGLSVIQTK